MTKEELRIIEKELDVVLPDEYIDIALRGELEEYGAEDFYLDYKKIISTNKRLRKNGLHGVPLRHEHFIIGKCVCGGYYYIVLNNEDKKVYLADRSTYWRYNPEQLRKNSDSLDGFIKFTIGRYEICSRGKNRDPNAETRNLPLEEVYRRLAEMQEKHSGM